MKTKNWLLLVILLVVMIFIAIGCGPIIPKKVSGKQPAMENGFSSFVALSEDGYMCNITKTVYTYLSVGDTLWSDAWREQ